MSCFNCIRIYEKAKEEVVGKTTVARQIQLSPRLKIKEEQLVFEEEQETFYWLMYS